MIINADENAQCKTHKEHAAKRKREISRHCAKFAVELLSLSNLNRTGKEFFEIIYWQFERRIN